MIDFPNSPAVNDTFTAANGVVYKWDGARWVVSVGAGAVGVSSFNTRTGVVVLQSADVSSVGGALLAGPIFTGDARAVTATAGDNDTSVATTAFVQGAVRYLNYADNSGFRVNQRGYVSGTALAAGVYAHDRWKAGAGGCTYTFTQSGGPATTITITAGTLQQVVEGLSLVGGNYMLSWTGTAQGRVGAGSYAASPVSLAGITAGANTTIEFNAGTLAQVKMDGGSVTTGWMAEPAQQDLARCQRFYLLGRCYGSAYGIALQSGILPYPLPVTMRAVPTVVVTSTAGVNNMTGIASVSLTPSTGALAFSGTITATAAWTLDATFTASADL